MKTVGVDIGGTTITVGIVVDNKLIKSKTIINEFIGAPNRIIDTIIEIIKELEELKNLSFIGVACPGIVQNSIIYGAVNLGYDNFEIAKHLTKKTQIHALAENDGTAALIGEMFCGSLTNYNNAILLTLGTGVGGGICINKKPYKGSTASAGEFGHTVYIRNGYPCMCGRKGCFEQYASTSALIRQIRETILDNKNSILYKYCSEDLNQINGKLFFEAVKNEDKFCLKILDSFTTCISEGIYDFINILDVEAVSIGGGISDAGLVLIDPIREKVRNYGLETNVIKATLGNLAGVIGAANLYRFQ
ncbi:MAG TPA: ROK family protein [Clostridiaceae bacterium]